LPRAMVERAEDSELFDLNRIILKACDNDPARRHRSAGELREALLQLQQGLLILKA
jgi:hypothetical protein